jgi:hypothetical protein
MYIIHSYWAKINNQIHSTFFSFIETKNSKHYGNSQKIESHLFRAYALTYQILLTKRES